MSSWAEVKQAESVESAERSGAEWSGQEMRQLAEWRQAGLSVVEMAERLDRSYYAVSSRLQVAGIAARRQTRSEKVVAACGECWLVHAGECR